MTDVLPNRWLRDDAFRLQLQAGDGLYLYETFQTLSDPVAARKMFVGLTLIRFSEPIRRMIRSVATDAAIIPITSPIRGFMMSVLMGIEDTPEEYPFCLSEREFEYYAVENFKHSIPEAEGIFKPPSFYTALAEDFGSALLGYGIGLLGAQFIPVEIAGGGLAAAIAPKAFDAAVASTGAAVVSHLLPGGSFDAAKLDRLWPRYEADNQRRRLS